MQKQILSIFSFAIVVASLTFNSCSKKAEDPAPAATTTTTAGTTTSGTTTGTTTSTTTSGATTTTTTSGSTTSTSGSTTSGTTSGTTTTTVKGTPSATWTIGTKTTKITNESSIFWNGFAYQLTARDNNSDPMQLIKFNFAGYNPASGVYKIVKLTTPIPAANETYIEFTDFNNTINYMSDNNDATATVSRENGLISIVINSVTLKSTKNTADPDIVISAKVLTEPKF